MCFITNIIIAGQKNLFSIILFSYRQNILKSRNLSPNMPKNALISLKNRKNPLITRGSAPICFFGKFVEGGP